MESLCANCIRRGPNPTSCTIPIAQIRAVRQPVVTCPFWETVDGRKSTHDLTGLLRAQPRG